MVVIAAVAGAASLAAHHSLAQFDTDVPLWIKGSIVRVERANPHSIIFLDQVTRDGKVERWAVDGPAPNQLVRMRVPDNALKAGDVIEVCGFALKGAQTPRVSPPATDASAGPSSPRLTGRVLNGHLLVMPDGKRRPWSNYGILYKCLNPGETVESLGWS
jgi:hypothetical protein